MTVVRRVLAATAALAAIGAASGCTSLGSTGGDKQYIDGGEGIVQIAPSHRGKPVSASGKDLDGQPLSLASYRGKALVVHVWGEWCPPCRKEMPAVATLADTLAKQGIPTVGVDIRDNLASARAMVANDHVGFPSFFNPDSSILLALSSKIDRPPTTVVLDPEGRVAALVTGPIPGQTTMRDIVHQVATGG